MSSVAPAGTWLVFCIQPRKRRKEVQLASADTLCTAPPDRRAEKVAVR